MTVTITNNTKVQPNHSLGEWRNDFAFAAIKADGSVVAWGYGPYGGDNSAVAAKLDGTLDATQIFSTNHAFAALRSDGSVVTWGDGPYGGDSSTVAAKLDGTVDVTQIFSTGAAFAALRSDGSVVTWGNSITGGNSGTVAAKLDGSVDVRQIFSTVAAFAALRADGSVVTWGDGSAGGNSGAVATKLDGAVDVTQVLSASGSFAALRADGSVVTWGNGAFGGDSSAVAEKLNGTVDVTQIFATGYAFAALRADGSVVAWGGGSHGGDSSAVAAKLDGTVDVTQVFPAVSAFAALRDDGSVVTWGDGALGGDSSAVAAKLNGTVDVTQIFSTDVAFAALRDDGSVVTWGDGASGGDSGAVAAKLDGTLDVAQIFSTGSAFAALRADGSVTTWGNSLSGGDSGAVAAKLNGTVDVTQIFSTDAAFAALRTDGSVVTWGYDFHGGDSSAVAGQLSSDVVSFANIYTNDVFSASSGANHAPAGTNKTVTLFEDSVRTLTAANFGFTDPNDSPANKLLAVKITTLPAAGSLTLNGSAVTAGQSVSAGDINAGLLKFTPAANASTRGRSYAKLTFQVRDDGGTANGGVDLDPSTNMLNFGVTPVNDAPAGSDKTVTLLEDGVYTLTAVNFGFTDPNDSPANALLAAMIMTLPAAGLLTLNGIAVTARQSVSADDINAGLLKFTPAVNAHGASYASLAFQVQDDGGTANGGVDQALSPNTLTFNVTAVNDAPAGTNRAVITLREDSVYTLDPANFGFTDPKDSPANRLLAVKITTLPAAGALTLNGIAVTAGQRVSADDIKAGLLEFTPAANAHGVSYARLTFQVQDDGGTANGGVDLDPSPNTLAFNVSAVNDAPAGADKAVMLLDNGVYTLAAADFGFTDPNDTPADTLLAVKITTLPTAGSLKLNGIAVTAGQSVSAADINAGRLKFTPAANTYGASYASLTFQVRDDGGTANGGVDLDPTANTLTVAQTTVSLTENDDFYIATVVADQVNGLGGDDFIYGLDGNDKLDGGAGDDSLYGGSGDDLLISSTGDDLFFGGSGNDSVSYAEVAAPVNVSLALNLPQDTLGAGFDTLVSIENLTGGTGNDALVGNGGANRLDGGPGGDTLTGGTGDDIYFIDNESDSITEDADEGADTVNSSITYRLENNVENLTLTGNEAISALGNTLDNILIGNRADNRLNGLGGRDWMEGGDGNDIYYVESSGDVIIETAAGGTDTVISARSNYTLGAEVENLTLSDSTSVILAYGNSLNNTLQGNRTANSLYGYEGADTLRGVDGRDSLVGGIGADTLTGGYGADWFIYLDAGDSGITASSRDHINDFRTADGDKIDLSAIDANRAVADDQVFSVFAQGAVFAGTFSAPASLFFDQTAKVLYGNNDADAEADFSIALAGVNGLALTDFIV